MKLMYLPSNKFGTCCVTRPVPAAGTTMSTAPIDLAELGRDGAALAGGNNIIPVPGRDVCDVYSCLVGGRDVS